MSESEATKRLKRYLRIIQGEAVLEVLILRAHLLIEEELRVLIDINLKYAEKFEHRQFSFNQCLILVSSIYGDQKLWLWESIKHLNGIRNILAHKLNPEEEIKIENKLEKIDLLVGENSGVPMPSKLKPSISRAHWRLASLYSVLCAIRETPNQLDAKN